MGTDIRVSGRAPISKPRANVVISASITRSNGCFYGSEAELSAHFSSVIFFATQAQAVPRRKCLSVVACLQVRRPTSPC
jgi:hypothetical protein